MRTLKVTEKSALLEYLFKTLADTRKTRVREFLKRGKIAVNGKSVTRHDFLLSPGDEIAIDTGKGPQSVAAGLAPMFGVVILYEDEDLAVCDKPAGLLTIATEKVRRRTAFFAVNDFLNARQTRPGRGTPFRRKQIFLVHRLDREASGVLVFAKSEEVKLWLQANWSSFRKKYFAVVEGTPAEREGGIESYLRENKFLSVYSSRRTEGAKRSRTRYRVLKSAPGYSLLEVELETGRKHQIRVHLSDLGHPIAGDDRYRSKTDPLGRLCLHAHSLCLKDPESGREMEFRSPMPDDFERLVSGENLHKETSSVR